jgi:hypothetical protein
MHLIIGNVSDLVAALNWHSVERKWAIDHVLSHVTSRSPACREHVAKCNVTVANGRWCSPDLVTRREEVAKSSPIARWEVAEVARRSLSITLGPYKGNNILPRRQVVQYQHIQWTTIQSRKLVFR